MSFDEFFNLNLPKVDSFHPYFNEAMSWILRAGGKHFRAKLLLGSLELLNPALIERAYPVAMAVELLHAYSLIHDDLPAMDNACFRRGVDTLHIKYDETTAILVGDGLNTQAFYMISKANLPPQIAIKCVEILSKNGGIYGMVIGQAIDCYFEKKTLSLDELKFLHLHKTGALIAASMELSGLIAGLSRAELAQIYEIGLKLGLAFQIHDDILDATSDPSSTGKPTQNDKSKNSFTNLLGLNEATRIRDEIENEILILSKPLGLDSLILELINKYLKG